MTRGLWMCLLSLTVCVGLLPAAEIPPVAKSTVSFQPDDWPWWRGPTRDGVAPAGQSPPTEFSATKNVVWQTSLPGRGHGSPIAIGPRLFLATAEDVSQIQSVVCLDRATGKIEWNTPVHRGKFIGGGNAKSSHASGTPACDGERLFITFINDNAVVTSALDVKTGHVLWQTKICDYKLHQGYGASPAVYGPLVIVMGDNKGGGALAGLDRVSGKIVWKHSRPSKPNYPSPIILSLGGRDQVVQTGCDLVTSLDPLTGRLNWEAAGATTECVTSIVTDGERVFTSGGYPRNHLAAMRADGSGKIEWNKNVRVYVPSMLVQGSYLYCVTDAGVAMCRECATGNEVWSARLRGTFSASLVRADDRIYAVNEAGEFFIFRATPRAFEKIAENKLGDEVFATPVITGNRIYQRIAHTTGGTRQEILYCLGEKK